MNTKNKKLPTTSYKGVRDFYPRDAFIHNYILSTMSRACEASGYENYNASILEPTSLYHAKESESQEIVADQTYTFTDRGGREVTLRPEMTPTVARMIAGKARELSFPVRWYSIPNCFRYERPQKGRLREFWQLNADIFGVSGVEADADNILLAYNIMKEFGAKDSDFEIRINDRQLLEGVFDELDLDFDQRQNTMRILDKRAKISDNDFKSELSKFLKDKTDETIDLIDKTKTTPRIEELISFLSNLGVTNTVIDTGTVRGFNYYTGIVFEVFDTSPDNNRSMFSGGRYDNLTSLFSNDKISGIGFGMGDVTIQAFLESRNLMPEYTPATEIMICVLDNSYADKAMLLAQSLRKNDVNTTINLSGKKIGDQIKSASKKNIPFIIPFGENESESDSVQIKHLESRKEETIHTNEIANYIFEFLVE